MTRFGTTILSLLCALAAGCAATDSAQGAADQGGSVGPTPTVVINIGTGGGIETMITPTPTAAPAASSAAEATQTATQSTDASVDPAAVTDAVKTLGGVPDVADVVE